MIRDSMKVGTVTKSIICKAQSSVTKAATHANRKLKAEMSINRSLIVLSLVGWFRIRG